MFGKNKVSQSMIDAVNKVLGEQPVEQNDVLLNEAGAPIKEPTSTGMKVYGRSYGNSAKAKQDQTKSSVDDLKGPKTKELLQKDKEEHEKTKGKYDEAAKPDFLDMDKDGDKKEPMKKAVADKKKMAEELKGDQHKIDANKNNKIDAHDFAILRGKKKVKEDMYFAKKLIEGMKRSDIPASVRKARGDAPLTPAEVKSGSKDSISDPKNLAKARNEEVELDESLMDHIEVKPAKKHKDPEILAVHDVHYKGKKVGDIQVYQHGSGMKYGSHHDASGNATAGHRTMDQAIDDIRQEHAQHLKSMREEVELDERTMTSADKTEREKIVKSMKKGLAGFKSRYGKDAKSVMYATATKQAMKEDSPKMSNEATIAGTSGWKKMPATVTDKSGAKHSPMSRAKDLAQQAFKKVQDKTKIKSEMMLGKDGGTSESKK